MAVQTQTATFNGAQPLSGGLPYVDVTWTTAYANSSAYRVSEGVNVSDGAGPVAIVFGSKTGAGVRVFASMQFTGTVELIAFDV